jgi:CubicO group peptidase (beta-lactamase class C family)
MIKKILLIVLVLLTALIVGIYGTGNSYVFKAIWYNYTDIDDYKIFDNRTIKHDAVLRWPSGSNYNSIQPDLQLRNKLQKIKTNALVVIRNDSLVYEEYWDEFNKKTISNSFSVAKSIVSTLIGIALQDGLIKSIDDPVSDYLTDFNSDLQKKVTIRHLLTMSSGSDWDESYESLFSIVTKAYYGQQLEELAKSVTIIDTPGTVWNYKSGDTELLALVLNRVTGKTLSEYASEKLWKPLNAEQDALWSVDREDGVEKAYCCFNATARDFARIGSLYLNEGKWKGRIILNEKYIKQALKPVMIKDEQDSLVNYYGYQWWLLPDRDGVYYARGIQGQYIIIIPKKKCVVVRLGKERGPFKTFAHEEVYDLVDWILKEY